MVSHNFEECPILKQDFTVLISTEFAKISNNQLVTIRALGPLENLPQIGEVEATKKSS